MGRISTKLEPIDRDIAVIFPDPFSDAARQRELIRYARQGLKDAQAQNERALGRIPLHKTFVDGQKDGRLENVKPDGMVVYEFDLLEDIFGWIGEQLIKHSPRGEGSDPRPDHPDLYMRSHVFTADLEVVDPGGRVPPASEYVFVNTQPYARKIERGLSDQAVDGVYQVVAKLAADRFGNMARIRFSYRTPNFGAIAGWASGTSMPSPYRRDENRAEWLKRQPAIVITPR